MPAVYIRIGVHLRSIEGLVRQSVRLLGVLMLGVLVAATGVDALRHPGFANALPCIASIAARRVGAKPP